MVTIIHPSADVYQGLDTAIEPPAWTRMIGGWLRDNGFKVSIIDQEAERLSNDQVASRVKGLAVIVAEGHQPSASTQQMAGVRSLAKALDETIIIGHHVSALPEKTLEEESVDYVCDGEGPLTIAGLLNDDPLEQIPGLVWKGGKNNRAPLIPIDGLHGDVWDLLPMDKYRSHNWQTSERQPYASIYTTLGCPFKCSFCMINIFQHKNLYRRRTPSKVVEQIRRLHNDYGVRTFKIADEMFVLNPSHYLSICEGLVDLDLNIWAYARVDTIRPDNLSLLRRAGIQWLALGIESGSSYVRDESKKHLKDKDIRDVVKAIQDAGINVIGNFIFGLPDDTQESMQETLDLTKSLNLNFANFYSCQAYPGSRLFDQTQPEDLPDSWSGYSQHSKDCKPLPTKTLTSAEVLKFRDYAHNQYYVGNDELTKPLHRDLCATN